MYYSKINNYDIANGTGVRVSLFVSGCSRHCKGCFNPETWNYNYGEPFTDKTVNDICVALAPEYISGLTILGGEPLDPKNVEVVTALAYTVKQWFSNKDIWVYTGYKYREVKDLEIMKYIDVLVDGEFIESEKDISLAFRGSSNQKIIEVQELREFERLMEGKK